MPERIILTLEQARMTLLHEVFGHTDPTLARALHRVDLWQWYDEENGPSNLQREQAVLADAQKCQTLVAGIDQVLTNTGLTERQQFAVRLRLGFDGQGIRRFAEIGEQLRITGTGARRIYGMAIKRLRHPSRSRELRQFLP